MVRQQTFLPLRFWISIQAISILVPLSVSAFQPDLVGQAIQTASSFSSATPPLDELIFAAVNLIDSQQKPLLVFSVTETPKEEIISAPSYLYDDEIVDAKSKADNKVQELSRTISLSDEEAQLLIMVKQVRDKHCPSTTLRIGGGWVRDKLLKRETSSPDIDFVLDNKSGNEFAQLMHDTILLEDSESDSASTATALKMKDYGETESRHLQTASLQVGDMWVDFCQLRFEKYKANSRVPAKIGIASVVEDAYRRDLTINSLFYNLNTNQVEDWTEQGLKDLRSRTIRTPTAPLFTLLEDPLRILRAIRFAAQLSFSMDPALKRAALDKRVRQGLQQKVSKERVGKELDAMFRTPDPKRGMELLIETRLMDIVFPLDIYGKEFLKLKASPSSLYREGYHLLYRVQTLVSRIFTQGTQWDETKRRYLWYAAFFKPFSDMFPSSRRDGQQGSKHQRDKNSIVHQLLVRGLKRPTCDSQSVEGIIKGANTLQKLLRKYDDSASVQALFSSKSEEPQLSREGRTIAEFRWLCYRTMKRIGPLWQESLILALASSEQYTPTQAVQLYDELVSGLKYRLGLDGAILALKPLLNGSQIQNEALPGVQGKGFKKIMESQEKWQVDHCVGGATECSDKEQEAALIDYLVKTFPQYH